VSTTAGPSVLRLTTIGPVPASATFDSMLRDEVLPAVLALDGIVDARVGRRFGPADVDERVVATFWAAREAMDEAIAMDSLARLEQEVTGKTEILPLAIDLRFDRPDDPARILRIFRGQIRPGELELYVEDARRGATADGATSHGPSAFFLSPLPPARFVSLSLWGDWTEIELSTGGNIRHPIATHHAERIVSGQAAHFEILPSSSANSSRTAKALGGGR
jgi:hypothetical protein